MTNNKSDDSFLHLPSLLLDWEDHHFLRQCHFLAAALKEDVIQLAEILMCLLVTSM